MPETEACAQLRETGIAVLRGVFARDVLWRLRAAAERCFAAIEGGAAVPERYRYAWAAHAVRLTALMDYGFEDEDELFTPLRAAGLEQMFGEWFNDGWTCRREHAWMRKKFAPHRAPRGEAQIQNWHQDGALEAKFAAEPGAAMPVTKLLTCWIPLQACGADSPGLEFVRGRQQGLLHYSELGERMIVERFGAEALWAPNLDAGDGLVFSSDVLHRTYVHAGMARDRLSVDYRIFPR